MQQHLVMIDALLAKAQTAGLSNPEKHWTRGCHGLRGVGKEGGQIDNRQAILDNLTVKSHFTVMEVESIRHKGLRRFFETGNPKGLVGDIERLRKMLAFIDAAQSLEELSVPPNYGLHELTGDRTGTWSMTVTRNWRLTFRLNENGALIDMNLEDYHGS
jgi:proteic killer suppression protein